MHVGKLRISSSTNANQLVLCGVSKYDMLERIVDIAAVLLVVNPVACVSYDESRAVGVIAVGFSRAKRISIVLHESGFALRRR